MGWSLHVSFGKRGPPCREWWKPIFHREKSQDLEVDISVPLGFLFGREGMARHVPLGKLLTGHIGSMYGCIRINNQLNVGKYTSPMDPMDDGQEWIGQITHERVFQFSLGTPPVSFKGRSPSWWRYERRSDIGGALTRNHEGMMRVCFPYDILQ